MASTYLTRTTNTSGASRTTWTWSGWIKRGTLSGQQDLFSAYGDGANYMDARLFEADENIQFRVLIGGNFVARKYTTRKLRDTSGWYNLIFVWDTTNSTASQRMRIYVNGVQETSFITSADPSSGQVGEINASGSMVIGAKNGADFFNGSMSYVAFVDGQALTPSTFGETDSDTGQWKIKTDIVPGGAGWGTNGFLILKNGNTITDQSGEGNNLTVGAGTLTNTLDCPDNVFATLNPLIKTYGTQVFSNGNTSSINSTNEPAWSHAIATLGVSTGKWYWEIKVSGSTPWIWTGIISEAVDVRTQYLYNENTGTFLYGNNGNKYVNGSATSSFFATLATNDIVSVALNLDDNKITFYKNGTATPNATALDLPANLSSTTVFPATTIVNGASIQSNFGNGYFGTTAVTSAGTAGSTPGTFEYDVPSGYEPLTTKGLNA